MTNVIELAHQAGGTCFDKDGSYGNYSAGSALFTPIELERFAKLVRNAALEEAAQKCRNNHQRFKSYTGTLRAHDEDIAAAVESLKEPKP